MSCTCCSRDPHSSEERYEPFISSKELRDKCPLDSKTIKFFKYPMVRAESASNISLLIKMPMEILQRSLKYLDIETLVNIRRCSQYCRLAVDDTLEWQEISENAPEALRAILCTGVGSHILLLQLHHALTNPKCVFCKRIAYLDGEEMMGAFLSLFEGKRACGYCLRNDISLRSIPYVDFMRLQRPNSAIQIRPEVRNPPKLRTLPGTYGYYNRIRRWNVNEPQRKTIIAALTTRIIPKHPFAARPVLDRYLAPHNAYVGFEREDEIARRYMTAISFPYFGKTQTHPNDKKRVAFHGCVECHLQERFHEILFLESLNPGGADAGDMICAEYLYKHQTRQWLNDVAAEKIHARDYHERIEGGEVEWRKRRQAPIPIFCEPDNSEEFRMYEYDFPLAL